MIIRAFKNGDEVALFGVFFSAVHEIASQDYTQEQIDAWASSDIEPTVWAENIKSLQPLIAEIDNKIVGYADIQPNGYIDHFFVSATYSRQGVGTQLMQCIHEKAKLLGINILTSDVSKTAEPFFLLNGFHIVERKFPIRHGVMLQNTLMQKNLGFETSVDKLE